MSSIHKSLQETLYCSNLKIYREHSLAAQTSYHHILFFSRLELIEDR